MIKTENPRKIPIKPYNFAAGLRSPDREGFANFFDDSGVFG